MTPTGIVAAALTPRREGPELDLAAAFELIDFLSSKRPAGIALLSVTGEFPHFTLDERARFVSLAVKRSRVPLIAGVTHSTFDGTLWLAKEAAYAGAGALLVMPPPFYRYSQDEVREFLHNLADQLDNDTPILIHHTPRFTSEVAPDTLADLLASGLFSGVVNECPFEKKAVYGCACFSGDDARFVAARSAGCDGALSPAACILPELMLGLDKAITGGDAERVGRLEPRLREFLDQIAVFPEPFGLREALAVRGVKTGMPATPPGPRTLHRLAEFRDWFNGWLPQVLKESSQ